MSTQIFALSRKYRAMWLMVLGLFVAAPLHATTPGQLWPRFSLPGTITYINLIGAAQNSYDFMATVTFQGAYNQNQLTNRLYVSTISDDPFWLANAAPANASGVAVSQLTFPSGPTNPDGALIQLLQTYGSAIKGYYICDPYNAPETCNMATTLAGIHDAMVVNPDNLAVMENATDNPNVPLLGDLRVYSNPILAGQYTWIGSFGPLVNNTTGPINQISNPSGASSATGWSTSGGAVTTATATGNCAGEGQTLKFTSSTAGSAWAYFPPTITASASTRPYIFSVQACVATGGSPAFLDVWSGGGDVQSVTIAPGNGWQTLQLAVPIPLSDISGNTTIKLEVRTTGTSGTVIYFHNAAAVGNRVAVDMYQYVNQLSLTNSLALNDDFANNYNLRDYAIAGKMFTFDLSKDNLDEIALFTSILSNTSSATGFPRTHDTPVMGYVDDETNDVPFLSSSTVGLFLNASNDYNNGSVWASLPQPASLTQPAPVAIAPVNNTIYVAMAASDGDNLSIVQHQNYQHWTQGQFLGAVPMAWTISPGMIYNSPGIITTFYHYLPQSQEMMAGPSGVGYYVGTSGTPNNTDVTTLADLTNGFMTMEGMSTVTSWLANSTDVTTFATAVNVAHDMRRGPVTPYTHSIETNSAHTVLDQQQVDYKAFPEVQIAAIQAVPFVSGAPNYIEALHDNLTMPPDDVLYIAQQLQLRGSHPYVFMTPSELAATVAAAGTGATNTQAVAGSTLTSAFPVNYLFNAQGQEPGAGVDSGVWAIGSPVQSQVLYSNQDFLGSGNTMMTVPKTAASNSYAWQSLGTTPNPMVVGRYYRFAVNVAGTTGSTAFMTINDGSANHQVTGTISSTGWTTLSQIVQMENATTGQIQVGITPSSTVNQTLYFTGTGGDTPGWFYSAPGTGGSPSLGGTTYASAQGNAQAFHLDVPASDGSQWVAQFPAGLAASTTYVGTVDLAGSGSAYLDLWNGSSDAVSSTVALTTSWQTVSATFTTGSSPSGTAQWEVRVPNSSSIQDVYFRNAMLTLPPANAPWFSNGVETGQTQPLTSTVDNLTGGGGETDVTSPILLATSTASHGGTYAIQYGGDATGGAATHAYMEAFTNGSTLTATSRLSYWVYPMTSTGSEAGASTMAGNNSTCTAIDIIFTNGTALRSNAAIVDQYGNRINPTYQCNHLQPNQWNYVTTNLSSLSGLTISRIDIGYDQPGGSGNYGGYVDDITISH
jgi:GxGYxYP putative glycoside hydrolase C-terminal domain/GxGYxY sequence motif in domain of unknown function N-terminal